MKKSNFVRSVSLLLVGGGTALLGACRENPLDVRNPNQPSIENAFATAPLTESLISKLFQQMFNGQYNVGCDDIFTQAAVIGFESASALGNCGMGARSAIPRPSIDNSIGNAVQTGNFRDYDQLSRNARSAANAISALRAFSAANVGLTAGANARARSFAYFALGYAHGHLSMSYDSAGVVSPEFGADSVPPLVGSSVVNAAALAYLDSAIAYAGGATATPAQVTAASSAGGWPIPLTWWNGPSTIDRPTWVRMMNSFAARFRAGQARTPAERTAVDWAKVIANATAGVTADVIVTASQTDGWFLTVLSQLAVDATWSQMTPFYLGMGDTTGAYDAWLQTSVNTTARATAGSTFLMRTPDRRFPSGETRPAQQTASGGSSRAGTPTGSILYFYNRPTGSDQPGYPWGTWQYDNMRFWNIRAGGGNGPWVILSRAESDLLAAEGYLQTNQPALAIPLIDRYRVRAGLPPIPAGSTMNSIVPGDNACVPRVPQPPNHTTTACGTVFEALKWEKRLETAFTGNAQWFIDARGWGDLYGASPLEWPVPYQETFARYGTGSYYLNARRAGVGTYGFGKDANF